jgi:hypothetical protein
MSQNKNSQNKNSQRRNSVESSLVWRSCMKTVNLEVVNVEIVADGRFFGLSAGDWTLLLSGFGLSALAVLLL